MAKDIANFKLGHVDATLGGTLLGHTKGGCEVSIAPTVHEKKVDDYGDSPVGAVDIGCRIEIKLMFAESDLAHIQKAIAGAALTSGATKDDVGIGKKAGTALTGATLVLHPVSEGASVDLDWNFHSVVPIGQPSIPYKIDEDTVFEVTFLALIDEGQTDGERLVRIGTSD